MVGGGQGTATKRCRLVDKNTVLEVFTATDGFICHLTSQFVS